jgi:hypothetical protein
MNTSKPIDGPTYDANSSTASLAFRFLLFFSTPSPSVMAATSGGAAVPVSVPSRPLPSGGGGGCSAPAPRCARGVSPSPGALSRLVGGVTGSNAGRGGARNAPSGRAAGLGLEDLRLLELLRLAPG